ncbi:MAG: VOC family protein [Nocardioidaceae bacterium]|jgi:predicted enzyme related to lactoylglutathione lyase|nr:VOC family protein [Nocardioidaceae bacterium]
MSGRVVHFEIPYDDQQRAGSFYTDAFGWKLTTMPDMKYVLVTTGPGDQGPSEPGFINGGLLARGLPVGTPLVVVDVDDIDDSLRKIENLGGTTVSAKQPVGDMGFAAYFKDPEGNLLGLWETA